MNSELYLDDYHRKKFKKQISLIVETFNERIAPAFDNIEAEADKVSNDYYDSFMSMPSSGEDLFDPASIAEDAREEGVMYYQGVSLMKYNNLAAWIAILYQFWEQQVRLFLYEEEKHYYEIDFKSFCSGNIITQIAKEFMDHDVDITQLASWPGVTELRLLCNTIKHGDGKSAEDLKKVRPDIFSNIGIFNIDLLDLYKTTLNDEVLNLTPDMLSKYGGFLVEFWDELPERMIGK